MPLSCVLLCSPSPSPQLPVASPSPSPGPGPAQIQLALLSKYPDGYTNPATANISAIGAGTCLEDPSTRLQGSVTVQQPGAGLCGANGLVPAGAYNVTQDPAPGTSFVGWEVYNATTGQLINSFTTPNLELTVTGDVTIVAVYSVPGLPSPSPAATPR